MPRTHGMEEYLEAVYVLDAEGGPVSPSKLADYLGVARPTVTQTVQRLSSSGLMESGPNKEVLLTEEGVRQAEDIVRRHRLLERWLTDELGLDWAAAHIEAGRLEHALSPLVAAKLEERMGFPSTCPHGNVIPGDGRRQQKGLPLWDAGNMGQVQVVRIIEQAEEDLELLRFLERTGIVPGANIKVNANQTPFEAGIQVEVNDESLSLKEAVARRVLVRPI